MVGDDIITLNKIIAKEYLDSAQNLKPNQRFSQEVIQLLITAIRDKKQLYNRLIIAEAFGYLTKHTELFSILVEIFLEKEKDIEGQFTDSLNFVAGNSMLKFSERKAEVKEILLRALRDSKFETVRLSATNLLGKEFQEDAKELKPIFKKIAREDKSLNVRIQAWQRFVGLAIGEEVKTEQEAIKREIVYSSVFKVLEKVQPGLQVTISRIIELSDQFYYEKAEEMRHFGIELHKYPEETYIEIIKEILESKNLKGKYFDFEQVFVRGGDEKTLAIAPIGLSKEYLCYNCGNIIEKETKICSSCNEGILKCQICKQPISFGEEAGKCSFCESMGHLDHFQEWIKVSGKCPTCRRKLPIEGIVPLSAEIKK